MELLGVYLRYSEGGQTSKKLSSRSLERSFVGVASCGAVFSE
jgi:hypothetical protein